MGREVRRVPVDFPHPRVWVQRYKKGLGSLWEHEPEMIWKEERQPMFDQSLAEAQARWDQERDELIAKGKMEEVYTQEYIDELKERYSDGLNPDYSEWANSLVAGQKKWDSVEDYLGERPKDGDPYYRPDGWPPVEERGWVVYETVSEGTPITPCFATPEELVDWLSEKGTEWDGPMSRTAAEAFVKTGFAFSAVASGGVLRSGLDAFEVGESFADA